MDINQQIDKEIGKHHAFILSAFADIARIAGSSFCSEDITIEAFKRAQVISVMTGQILARHSRAGAARELKRWIRLHQGAA